MAGCKAIAVAGVVALLALSGARACDDFDEEMAVEAARAVTKAARMAAGQPVAGQAGVAQAAAAGANAAGSDMPQAQAAVIVVPTSRQ
jgi:hypothetical protein